VIALCLVAYRPILTYRSTPFANFIDSPAIGTLRSKYVPDENKSVILSLFGIPLNSLVVLAYLFIKQLGMSGALGLSSAALAIATGCMARLRSIARKDEAATAA